VSGCVQVDAGKPLIIAVSLSLTETQDTDFLAEFQWWGAEHRRRTAFHIEVALA
jgi:hypothetical protein